MRTRGQRFGTGVRGWWRTAWTPWTSRVGHPTLSVSAPTSRWRGWLLEGTCEVSCCCWQSFWSTSRQARTSSSASRLLARPRFKAPREYRLSSQRTAARSPTSESARAACGPRRGTWYHLPKTGLPRSPQRPCQRSRSCGTRGKTWRISPRASRSFSRRGLEVPTPRTSPSWRVAAPTIQARRQRIGPRQLGGQQVRLPLGAEAAGGEPQDVGRWPKLSAP